MKRQFGDHFLNDAKTVVFTGASDAKKTFFCTRGVETMMDFG
jgi:hypothetical protein